jgi:hypothetical protein
MQKCQWWSLVTALCCGAAALAAGPDKPGPTDENFGACCYHAPDGSIVCIVASDLECQQYLHGVFQGTGTGCNPSPCAQAPAGACCYTDTTGPHCAILFPLECELRGGQYQGNGSTCNPNPCVQTGACCYRNPTNNQWTCIVTTQTDCESKYGGVYQGNATNCGPPLPCQSPPPNGACCYVDAAGIPQCIVVGAIECDSVYHGTYQGNNTTCNPNPCSPPATGACCYQEPGLPPQCIITTAADCDAVYHGVYHGDNSTCNPNPCLTGACCYQDPTGGPGCVVTTPADCDAVYHGIYQGNGTPCTPNPCGATGACCVQHQGQYYCVVVTQAECEQLYSGTWLGPNTVCYPNPCVPTGACCYGQPITCVITTQADCANVYNGTYAGDNTTCTPNPCVPKGACCVKDDGGNTFCTEATQVQCLEQLHGTYFGDYTFCTPTLCPKDTTKCDCVSGCDSHTPKLEDPAFAPFIGSSVVATQYDPLNSNRVVVCVDISGKGGAPINMHWGTTRYSHPSWTDVNLGTVFGVTVDNAGNIYVTATTSYYTHIAGPGGWGAVYKIAATTGAISTFATLPNTGPGLGNITYDAANSQFFVSNFEDGRIYRLSLTGACLGSFSHATYAIGG